VRDLTSEPLCPDLELDDNLLPDVCLSEPLPPLPAPDQVAEARVLDVFISSNFLEYLSPSRIRDLHHRYCSFPASLIEDQLALLFACLCVGTSLDLIANPGDESRAVAWYRHTVDSLQRWGGSSCTALRECDLPRVTHVQRPCTFCSTSSFCSGPCPQRGTTSSRSCRMPVGSACMRGERRRVTRHPTGPICSGFSLYIARQVRPLPHGC
jgi:hypothetical protein